MANILIASLGESPIVVTAMYDLLTEQEKYEFEKVVVLRPEGDDVLLGYELVEEALKSKAVATVHTAGCGGKSDLFDLNGPEIRKWLKRGCSDKLREDKENITDE